MTETPAQFLDARQGSLSARYPADDLRRFSYHTGGTPRRLAGDEPCPVLFRDVGLPGMALFLAGRMRRLAGPLSPVAYLRSADYREPYTDHEGIGRLVLLRPLVLHPWHSGLPTIYVARSERPVDWDAVAFVPGGLPLPHAAALAADVPDAPAWRETLGGRTYDQARRQTLANVELLLADLAETEKTAGPLRRALQSPDPRRRDAARRAMETAGVSENDLCAAWHHLPRDRRAAVREGLRHVRTLRG